MEFINIGRRVKCPGIQDGEGTIVRSDRRRLLAGETVAYDIIWDNGASTRALSMSELRRPEWIALPDSRSVEACNELWFHHLMEMARSRGQRTSPAISPAPATSSSAATPAPKRQAAPGLKGGAGEDFAGAPASRAEITARARQLLAKHGIEHVAVHTSQRVAGNVLQIAWMDGPAEGAMYAALAELKSRGAVARIDLARSASTLTLQAAITYIHETFFAPQDLREPEPELQRVLLMATTEAYQRDSLTAVSPPIWHPYSGCAYQTLIRCVFERWDDLHARFCDISTWRHARMEKAALFPMGDQEASMRMRAIRDRMRLTQQQAEELLNVAAESPSMRA